MNSIFKIKILAVCFSMFAVSTSIAQRPNATTPSFNHLVSAKVIGSNEKAKVILMIQSFRRERQRVKTTTEIFLIGENGEDEKRMVDPKIRERVQVSKVPAGIKPKTVDAKEIQFFDVNLKPVSIADVMTV